ncbi:hypothetical protein BSY240_2268 [Agrobacterium sp. RAC06]|nr:hypothetical protein BSY240_2268 [Agrobacterium sp. RAC06]
MVGPYAAAHETLPMQASKGARTIANFADRKIYVECLRCEIRRRYDGSAMLARVSARVAMPDLLNMIARGNGCILNDAPTPNGIRCGMHYCGAVETICDRT